MEKRMEDHVTEMAQDPKAFFVQIGAHAGNTWNDPLFRLMHGSRWSGVAVEPVRGKAVVWYHERPDGAGTRSDDHLHNVEPLAWHCGCRVKEGGGERWALQKFKEHPRNGRAPERFYEVLAAHRDALEQEQEAVGVELGTCAEDAAT